jgi:hypothetical protein
LGVILFAAIFAFNLAVNVTNGKAFSAGYLGLDWVQTE